MIKVGSLRYGVIFKKAFSDPEIFTGFARDILDVKLSIDHVETEKSFNPGIGKVDVRFDLFAEDRKNRVIVDIQHIRYPDHYHRFLHYHCVALVEMISSSKDYHPDTSVYTIVVLTSGDKHKQDITFIDFAPRNFSGETIKEIPHKIFFLTPKYVNPKTPEPFKEWMMAIDDSLDEEVDETKYQKQEIHKIFQLIEKDIITPKEYAQMKDEYSQELLFDEKYEKGIEEGHKSGVEEGLKSGIEEGIKITALNLKKAGLLSYDQIVSITGLSIDKVMEL